MEQRKFGRTRSVVPMFGEGTWYIDGGRHDEVIAALQRGLDVSMTHIDTAEMYGDSAADLIDGEAIAGRRDKVFLVSKVLPQHASPSRTIAACEKSLARLKTHRLDCYLLHWPGPYPLEETGHGHFPGPRPTGGQLLQEIARARSATPRQVARRFLVRRPAVFKIPKASTVKHARENADTGDLQLTGPVPRSLPML